MSDSVRVVLPAHLRAMAKVQGEVRVDVEGEVTQRSVLDALEAEFPMLLGTIRDRATAKRRAFVRFYACEEDLSHEEPDAPLPERVVQRRGAVHGHRRDGRRLTRGRAAPLPRRGRSGPVVLASTLRAVAVSPAAASAPVLGRRPSPGGARATVGHRARVVSGEGRRR